MPSRRAITGVRVSVTDGRGRALRGRDTNGLGAWLAAAAPATATGIVSVAIVSDTAMRRLNRQYRRVDRATDVLSFPAEPSGRRPGGDRVLGDLAIARGVAIRQARDHGHSVRIEMKVLALHGLLHLLGYDHEVDRGRMAKLEERLRRRAGLSSGLIGRQRSQRAHR
jgi:probable rRNA maturation factor